MVLGGFWDAIGSIVKGGKAVNKFGEALSNQLSFGMSTSIDTMPKIPDYTKDNEWQFNSVLTDPDRMFQNMLWRNF